MTPITITTDKVQLSFVDISQRLKQLNLPEIDWVVGIGSGGIVPASLIAHQLSKPLSLLSINYRAENNVPQHDAPKLLTSAPVLPETGRILLVDDVSVSGQTMALAKSLLHQQDVVTLVLKGSADYVVFPEISTCVHWPWKNE
ncbi:MAG: phosphoribosyltransferase [Anaerolineaceae bacterium]|nr:phosphoribosyltransferase [Anaerolineaceae bacterium]